MPQIKFLSLDIMFAMLVMLFSSFSSTIGKRKFTYQEVVLDIKDAFLQQTIGMCTNLWVHNRTQTDVQMSKLSESNVITTSDYIANRKNELTDMLLRHASCLAAVTFEDGGLDNLIDVMNMFRKSSVIKIGGTKPKSKGISQSNHPIVWISIRKQINIDTFCPKEDKAMSRWITPVIDFNKLDTIINCPHYLSKLTLSRGGLKVHTSRIINGQKVYGSFPVRIFEYLSIKYNFTPRFVYGTTGNFNPKNGTWSGVMGQLENGKLFVTSGSMRERMGVHFDLSTAHTEDAYKFLSRAPKVLNRYDNLILPFTPAVWIWVLTSLVVFSITFGIIYAVYSLQWLSEYCLHRIGFSYFTFPLYTIFRIKEPTPVPWFRSKVSTGRFLTFQYTVFCFTLIAMYSSNLKAQLVVVGYEKPIDTLEDVLDNGQTPWLMIEIGYLTKNVLEQSGLTKTKLYELVLLAERLGGIFSFTRQKGFPIKGLKDMINNGGVTVLNYNNHKIFAMAHRHILQDNLLYSSKETLFKVQYCLALKKYSPVSDEVNEVLITTIEMGLTMYWAKETESNRAKTEASFFKTNEHLTDQQVSIQVKHLLMPLAICIVFWLISLVVLLNERNNKNLHKKIYNFFKLKWNRMLLEL